MTKEDLVAADDFAGTLMQRWFINDTKATWAGAKHKCQKRYRVNLFFKLPPQTSEALGALPVLVET